MIKYLSIFCLFFVGCVESDSGQKEENILARKQLEVKYSTGFSIVAVDGGYSVTVRNPQDTTQILGSYLFAQSDSSAIKIPIQTAVLNSTTFGAFFHHLDVLGTVKGLTYTASVKNRAILNLVDSGEIVEMISGDAIDFERMVELSPDVVLAYSFGQTDFSRYAELGIPVVLLMDYKESHPLGRAEWIKVVGCLTGKYDEAVEIFNQVEEKYFAVKQLAMDHSTFPSAFTGSRYGDFWFAPGRDSYIAKFIKDAGAIYTFNHIEGQESAELDFEQALVTISQADYWGLVVSSKEPFTSEDILKMSPLYKNLEAFRNDQIFVCNTAEVDYFGDAIMEPHLILSDLYRIFHPDVEADSDVGFHYFKPID